MKSYRAVTTVLVVAVGAFLGLAHLLVERRTTMQHGPEAFFDALDAGDLDSARIGLAGHVQWRNTKGKIVSTRIPLDENIFSRFQVHRMSIVMPDEDPSESNVGVLLAVAFVLGVAVGALRPVRRSSPS